MDDLVAKALQAARQYDGEPATSIPAGFTSDAEGEPVNFRPLNFDALRQANAVRVTNRANPDGTTDTDPNAGFSIVSGWNDAMAAHGDPHSTVAWPDNLGAYGTVADMFANNPEWITPHKYRQILHSARELGMRDEDVYAQPRAHGGEVDAALHAVRHHLAGGGFLSDLFSGPDYLSTGEVTSPTNWGDPEVASDFFKADRALRLAREAQARADDVTGSIPVRAPLTAPRPGAVEVRDLPVNIPFAAPDRGVSLLSSDISPASVTSLPLAYAPTQAAAPAVNAIDQATGKLTARIPEEPHGTALTKQQADYVIRTIAAETSGKSPEETQAIASVILNRINSGKYGSSPEAVLFAKRQFEPWMNPAGANYPMKISPKSQRYSDARDALEAAMAGEDITGGATNFWAPAAQEALGRPAPSWGRTGGVDIGATRFHKLERAEGGEVEDYGDGGLVKKALDFLRANPELKPYKGGSFSLERQGVYNPKYFDLKRDDLVDEAGNIIASKDVTIPREGFSYDLPAQADPGKIFRGMSAEEFANFQKNNYLQSLGTHNIGEGQKGLTYFSVNPDEARSYAHSFAPSEFKPDPARPAYVVAAKRPPDESISRVPGTGESEIGVIGQIPREDVTNVYRGNVVDYIEGIHEPGARVSPSSSVHWEEIHDYAHGGEVGDALRVVREHHADGEAVGRSPFFTFESPPESVLEMAKPTQGERLTSALGIGEGDLPKGETYMSAAPTGWDKYMPQRRPGTFLKRTGEAFGENADIVAEGLKAVREGNYGAGALGMAGGALGMAMSPLTGLERVLVRDPILRATGDLKKAQQAETVADIAVGGGMRGMLKPFTKAGNLERLAAEPLTSAYRLPSSAATGATAATAATLAPENAEAADLSKLKAFFPKHTPSGAVTTRTGADILAKDPYLAANVPVLSKVRGAIPFEDMSVGYEKIPGYLEPRKTLSMEDLEGAWGVPLLSDLSSSGVIIHEIGGKKLTKPFYTEGGGDFPRGPAGRGEAPAGWASMKDKAQTYMNSLERRIPEGERVVGIQATMSPEAADSADMFYQAMLRQIPGSKITKAAIADVDAKMAAKFPGWPGIMNTQEAEDFMQTLDLVDRKQLAKTLDLATHQKAGFPDVGQTRFAITEPRLFGSSGLRAGYSVAELDPRGGLLANPSYPHSNYTGSMAAPKFGAYLGGLPSSVHVKDIWSDWWNKLNPAAHDPKQWPKAQWGMMTQFPAQKIDAEMVDRVMKQQEQHKRLFGWRKGGEVNLEP